MADRYFVNGGGSTNWNNTANWSATSGGAGGETVPTSADDVFFDSNSTVNCILDVNGECASLTQQTGPSGYTKYISGSSYTLSVHGDVTLSSASAYLNVHLKFMASGNFSSGAIPYVYDMTIDEDVAIVSSMRVNVYRNFTMETGSSLTINDLNGIQGRRSGSTLYNMTGAFIMKDGATLTTTGVVRFGTTSSYIEGDSAISCRNLTGTGNITLKEDSSITTSGEWNSTSTAVVMSNNSSYISNWSANFTSLIMNNASSMEILRAITATTLTIKDTATLETRSISSANFTTEAGTSVTTTEDFIYLTSTGPVSILGAFPPCNLIAGTNAVIDSITVNDFKLHGNTVTLVSGATIVVENVFYVSNLWGTTKTFKSSTASSPAYLNVWGVGPVFNINVTDIDSSGGSAVFIAGGTTTRTVNWTSEPYPVGEIYTYEDLQNMQQFCMRDYALKADIDCEGEENFVPIFPSFWGNFDGEGHTIKNLTIEDGDDINDDNRQVGLFRYIYTHDSLDLFKTPREMKNFIFENASIRNNSTEYFSGAGIFAGWAEAALAKDCEFINCSISGDSKVGLLFGEAYCEHDLDYDDIREETIVENIKASSCFITARHKAGGLVGDNYGLSFINCEIKDIEIEFIGGTASYNAGAITGSSWNIRTTPETPSQITNCTVSGLIHGKFLSAGGLCGFLADGFPLIKNCSSSVNIEILSDPENLEICAQIGGFIGGAYGHSFGKRGTITNCSCTGNVSAENCAQVGGFIGYAEMNINSCFCTGNVEAEGSAEVGGFIGENEYPVSLCYSSGEVYGGENVGGFVGYTGEEIINKCYSLGNVYVYKEAVFGSRIGPAGGFAGGGGDISNCYCEGNVFLEETEDAVSSSGVGGFIGWGRWSVLNCYSSGDVSSTISAGGFCAYTSNLSNQPMKNCYSVGKVEGEDEVGGFIGILHPNFVIENCSWNVASADNAIGDLDGSPVETLSEEGLGSDEEDPEEFYKKSHVVYDQNDPDGWDFVTPVWYAWTYKYPLFVPQPVSVGFVLHGKKSGAIERIPGGNDQYKADFVQKLCYHSETHTKEAWDSNGKKFTPSHTFDGEFKNGYDRNPDTMRRLEIYKSGDGSIKGDLTHEHVWDEPRRIEDVYFNVRLSNYMGNYAGRSVPVGRRIRVYLKKESGWDADPVYEVVNNVYGSNKWNHWDVVHTVAGPWDGVLGVKIILFGNSYSFEGDRQQRNRFIFYDVRCNGLYDSYSFRLAKKVLGRMGHWNNAFLTQETAGTWTSPTMKINARTLHFMFWNPSLSSNDSIIFYTRTGETEEECLAAEWSAGLTNPNGTQITSPPDVWIQYKIEFTAVDTRISNPRVFFASGHVVKFTYEKGAIVAETSVNMEYEIGFRNFEDPMKDKFFKKLNITHLAFDSSKADAGIVDIEWETEHSANTFIVDLSKNPRHWESFYHDTAIGREMNLRFLKSDLNPYRLREIKMMYSEYPVVL